ncbi:MAG: helix-turn-helix domain-containing protein [Spirochaetes bacterium]|nr:helix-turn-helix domain-containing protein [Spirochaetota bacterium]
MIQVIGKMHELLLLLAKSKVPLSLHELASGIHEQDSTAANIVKTMKDLGYIRQTAERKGYVLGTALHYLVRNHNPGAALADAAGAHVEALSREINESCHLVVEYMRKRVVILRVKSPAGIHLTDDLDSLEELHTTCTGLMLLGAKDDDIIRRYCDSIGVRACAWAFKGVRSSDGFCDALRSAAHAGLLIVTPAHEDIHNGAALLAFAVRRQGRIIAALGIKMPSFRFRGENRKKVLAAAIRTVQSIETIINDLPEEFPL